jgi:hypothetical protein
MKELETHHNCFSFLSNRATPWVYVVELKPIIWCSPIQALIRQKH